MDGLMERTTSVPKSVHRYVVDKVKLIVPIWGSISQCSCPELKFPIKVFHMSQSMFFYHARKFSASQQKTPRFKTNVHGYLSMKYLKNWWHKEMVLFKFSSLHIFWIKSTCEIEWKQREIKNVYVHKPRAGGHLQFYESYT